MENHKFISLIIPVLNESESLEALADSIKRQTFPPSEIILVDGGSTDNTVEIGKKIAEKDKRFRVIEAGNSTPGRGRNVGIEKTQNDWIAFTDAGIRLKNDWLENLVKEVEQTPEVAIVYGNYSPLMGTFFEKCAAISYVSPLKKDFIRGKSIASSMLRKKVWEAIGGFPDLRAAEDLIFIEAVDKQGFNVGFAPKAMAYWQLRPNLISTFRKFVLYSKYNVWAKRQWDWHYGIARQYIVVSLFILLSFFHSWWWICGILIWLFARTAKRILVHHYEFGLKPLLNPIYFFSIMFIILTIDLATFIGWGQAVLTKKN